MHVVLWDTRKLDVSKDFAGGMGVGQFPRGGGIRGSLVRHFYKRDRRPTAMLFAYLAAIFRQLGHDVAYSEDKLPVGADLYVFNPSLITIHLEREAMARAVAENPSARVLAVGAVATMLPDAFDLPGVTVVKGEPEQLLWKLDEVLEHPGKPVQLGVIEDLDALPFPDWSSFAPQRFRIGYDFWRFPTGLVQSSRGCAMKCNYCPYIALESATRFREPEAVIDEIEHGIQRYGFRSFKFRDPLFGLSRVNVFRLAELLGRLRKPIQFSIETRVDLLRPEVLRVLKRVGLTSVTVGIETPAVDTLRQHRRVSINNDRQRDFIQACRAMGIRTVAGFMLGFPNDTDESIREVVYYARQLGPTFANFNVVTPYPGTEFFEQIRPQIADTDFSHYTVYTPVLRYEHLSAERITERLHWATRRFYFRWQYLFDNAHLLWPGLQRLGLGRVMPDEAATTPHPTLGGPRAETPSRRNLRQDTSH